MKPNDVASLLQYALTPESPILITGAPGIGKTSVCEQAALANGWDMLVSHPVVSDPVDYKGLPALVDGKAEFLPYADLRALLEATRPTLCLLDDLGQAPPAVQAACMQLLLARRVNGHRISDHVMFCAATNRKADRAGVSGILEPVKSRFAAIVEMDADLESWVAWALAHDVTIETIAFLRFRPELLHKFEPTTEIRNTPSPRTWAKLDAVHQQLEQFRMSDPQVIRRIEPEAYAGAVGEGAAAEYLGFLRIWRDLPDVDAVLMSPATAPVPTDAATLYALTGALAHKVQKDSMDRFCQYSKRLPEEFSVRMVRDAVSQKPEVTGTRAYVEWASAMKDLII